MRFSPYFLAYIKNSSYLCSRKGLNNAIMKTEQSKQMPYGSENTGVGNPAKQYFTADEAMAFLEPRIRAMFKYLGNNQLIGHRLDIAL